ncbi:diguanylate cyclase domain-containing protein [Methylorubrum thiocyanatum]|uniref:diguanylate cyclase domain-containing protein n=1 Tax=Methylorubrum thiocyanatum TaxID=47958 RepID=UPI00383A02AA
MTADSRRITDHDRTPGGRVDRHALCRSPVIVEQHRKAAINAIVAELDSCRQSVTDPLTGLVKRRGLEEAYASPVSPVGVRNLFYLDLDGFKQVNDHLDDAAGNILLREVADRVRGAACPEVAVVQLAITDGAAFGLLFDQAGLSATFAFRAVVLSGCAATATLCARCSGVAATRP